MLLILLSLMVSVGFFTLAERKILGLSQLRLGPNKTMIMGLVQPVLDGLKLFKKLYMTNLKMFFILYQSMSFVMLLIAFILWITMPFYSWGSKMLLILLMLFILGLSSFCLLLLGWSSYNKYSFLGSIRSLGQTMSFEANFGTILFTIFLVMNKMSLSMSSYKSIFFFIIFSLPLWFLILLETQRSPLDLSEGESELVSGYNVEFSSIMFTFIFLSEYANMILLSGFFWLVMSNFMFYNWIGSLFLLLLMRTCFPRLRFDLMFNMSWMKLLPFVLCILILMYPFKLM